MAKQSIVNQLEELAAPFIEEHGLILYDAEAENSSKTLRLFIDKENGIQLEDCEKVARKLDEALTEAEVYGGDFTLEVSSPGVERKLRKKWHYEKVLGKNIELKLFEALGRMHESAPKSIHRAKTLQGKLISIEGDTLKVEIENASYDLPLDKVTKAHLVYDF